MTLALNEPNIVKISHEQLDTETYQSICPHASQKKRHGDPEERMISSNQRRGLLMCSDVLPTSLPRGSQPFCCGQRWRGAPSAESGSIIKGFAGGKPHLAAAASLFSTDPQRRPSELLCGVSAADKHASVGAQRSGPEITFHFLPRIKAKVG